MTIKSIKFGTIADVRAANKALGHHFFERDAMQFAGSIIYPHLYGGTYFVTSEEDGRGRRGYSVREAQESGAVETVAKYPTIRLARDVAQAMGREVQA